MQLSWRWSTMGKCMVIWGIPSLLLCHKRNPYEALKAGCKLFFPVFIQAHGTFVHCSNFEASDFPVVQPKLRPQDAKIVMQWNLNISVVVLFCFGFSPPPKYLGFFFLSCQNVLGQEDLGVDNWSWRSTCNSHLSEWQGNTLAVNKLWFKRLPSNTNIRF